MSFYNFKFAYFENVLKNDFEYASMKFKKKNLICRCIQNKAIQNVYSMIHLNTK